MSALDLKNPIAVLTLSGGRRMIIPGFSFPPQVSCLDWFSLWKSWVSDRKKNIKKCFLHIKKCLFTSMGIQHLRSMASKSTHYSCT